MPNVPSVLFVCTGNICRSPMAEAVLRHMAQERTADLVVDSAGIERYHVGESAHCLTLRMLSSHGIDHPGKARQVRSQDFQTFDHIIAMDQGHREALCAWPGADILRVTLLHDWQLDLLPLDVPDPYYGPERQYEEVFEIVSIGSRSILDRLFLGA